MLHIDLPTRSEIIKLAATRAATFGAIDTLIVYMDAIVPGTLDDESGADTYDVVDEIVSRALKSGARVPGKGALAAMLRCAI